MGNPYDRMVRQLEQARAYLSGLQKSSRFDDEYKADFSGMWKDLDDMIFDLKEIKKEVTG